MVKFRSCCFRIILFCFLPFPFTASFSQDDSIKKDLSFDFGITRGRNINLWPVLRRVKSEEKSDLQILYPLFSKTINFKSESKHLHVLPFFVGDSSSKGIDRRFLSLYYPSVFRFQKQNLSGSKISSFRFLELAPNISCLSFGRSTDGLFVENNMFFFIWYKKDLVKNKTRMVVFPAYWYLSDKRDTTQLFFPLFYSKKSGSGKRSVLFPLWWRKTEYLSADTITRSTFFPLYWSSKSRETNNRVLFPLAYSFNNQNRKSLTVFPLLSYRKEKQSGDGHLAITPLYWHLEQGNSSKDILFPLYWRSKRFVGGDTIIRNTVFPLFWSKRSVNESNSVFFPFAYRFKNRFYQSFTFLPLFSVGHSSDRTAQHLSLFPLIWHSKSREGLNTFVFPLWWTNKKYFENDTVTRKIFFSLYWSVKSKTRDNSVFFPLVYSFKDRNYESFTFFPFYSSGKSKKSGSRYTAVTPFLWHFKNSSGTRDVLFPLFWSSKKFKDGDTIKKSTVFPLYWSTESRDKNNQVFFPFIYRFQNSDYRSFTFFPFFSRGQSADSRNRYFAITPLYWHIENENSKKDILFPFYWSSRLYLADDTVLKRTIFPVYRAVKSKKKNNQVLFPLVYRFNNQHRKSFTVFPLFSYGSRANSGKKYFAITPLFWHHEREKSEMDVLFPLYWGSKNWLFGDTVIRKTFFPLYWSVKKKDRRTQVFFPFVFRLSNPRSQSLTVFPLFSFGHKLNSERKYFAITPLFWHLERAKFRKDVLFPLYWSKTRFADGDTVSRKTFFPIYWSEKSREKSHHVLLPFVFKFNNPSYKSLTVLPFFSTGHSPDFSKRHFDLFPVFWKVKTNEGQATVLFPFWWSHKKYFQDDTIAVKLLFPFYWAIKSSEKNNRFLFPFVYKTENRRYSSFTFFPFYSGGHSADLRKSYSAITPLFWRFQSSAGSREILFPLYWGSKRYFRNDTITRNAVFPLYWSKERRDETRQVFIPFIFRFKNPGYRSFTFFPFYSAGQSTDLKNRYLGITPFYWHSESPNWSRDVLFPFFWGSRHFLRDDTIRRNTVFPFYWSKESKDEVSQLFIPFVYRFKNPEYRTFTFFPFYSGGSSADKKSKYSLVIPFLWRFKNPEGTRDVLFPLYWGSKRFLENDTIKKNTVFPLYWSKESRDGSYQVLFPLAWRFSDKRYSSFTFFPFFSAGHSPDRKRSHFELLQIFWHTRDREKENTVLLPFWWSNSQFFENDTISFKTFFPFYWSVKSKVADNRIFFPLVYKIKNQHWESFTLFPLVFSGHKTGSDKRILAVTPLFWQIKNARSTNSFMLPVFWRSRKYLDNDTIVKTTFFPLYWSKKSKGKSHHVLFPLMYSFKNKKFRSFTFFPLFSTGHSADGNKSHLMVTPFAGVFRKPGKTRAFLFPVFNYKKTPDESRSSAFLFLFRRTVRENYSKTSVLWPICERLKSADNSSFRIAPFVWYAKTDSSKMLSVLPFFYSYKGKAKSSFSLFWILYKHENNAGISVANSILWKLFTSEKFVSGDFEKRFIYLMYSNILKEGRREKSLLPFYHNIKEPNGDISKSVFFGFYNYFKEYIPAIGEHYEEERLFWLIRIRSNYSKLKSEGKEKYLKRK